MKNFILTTVVFPIFLGNIFSQDLPKKYNELSFGINNNSSNILYRFGNINNPNRLSIGASYNYYGEFQKDEAETGIRFTRYNHNYNVNLSIGKQKNFSFLDEKAIFYVGAELGFGTGYAKNGIYREIVDSVKSRDNGFLGRYRDYVKTTSEIRNNLSASLRPLLGINYKLSDRFYLGAEYIFNILYLNYYGSNVNINESIRNGNYQKEMNNDINPDLSINTSLGNGNAVIRAVFILSK